VSPPPLRQPGEATDASVRPPVRNTRRHLYTHPTRASTDSVVARIVIGTGEFGGPPLQAEMAPTSGLLKRVQLDESTSLAGPRTGGMDRPEPSATGCAPTGPRRRAGSFILEFPEQRDDISRCGTHGIRDAGLIGGPVGGSGSVHDSGFPTPGVSAVHDTG